MEFVTESFGPLMMRLVALLQSAQSCLPHHSMEATELLDILLQSPEAMPFEQLNVFLLAIASFGPLAETALTLIAALNTPDISRMEMLRSPLPYPQSVYEHSWNGIHGMAEGVLMNPHDLDRVWGFLSLARNELHNPLNYYLSKLRRDIPSHTAAVIRFAQDIVTVEKYASSMVSTGQGYVPVFSPGQRDEAVCTVARLIFATRSGSDQVQAPSEEELALSLSRLNLDDHADWWLHDEVPSPGAAFTGVDTDDGVLIPLPPQPATVRGQGNLSDVVLPSASEELNGDNETETSEIQPSSESLFDCDADAASDATEFFKPGHN